MPLQEAGKRFAGKKDRRSPSDVRLRRSLLPPLTSSPPPAPSRSHIPGRRAMNNELLFHASEMLVISHEISIFGYEEIAGPRRFSAAEMEREASGARARARAHHRRDEILDPSINYNRAKW